MCKKVIIIKPTVREIACTVCGLEILKNGIKVPVFLPSRVHLSIKAK
jgi:hypothetical protein